VGNTADNNLKYAYNEEYQPELFEQVNNVRQSPLANSPLPFPETLPPPSPLIDETAWQDSDPESKDEDGISHQSWDDEVEEEQDDDFYEEDEHALNVDNLLSDNEDETPKLRCPCLGTKIVDAPAESLFATCSHCKTQQHKECVSLSLSDPAPESHLCHYCDNELNSNLLDADTTIVLSPLNSVNIGRSRHTCYIAAPLQDLLRFPVVQQILQQDLRFLRTGRSSSDLTRLDDSPDYSKLAEFFRSLRDINKQMMTQQQQLDSRLTSRLLKASQAINPSFEPGKFKNSPSVLLACTRNPEPGDGPLRPL
jgi:hypothetical protein